MALFSNKVTFRSTRVRTATYLFLGDNNSAHNTSHCSVLTSSKVAHRSRGGKRNFSREMNLWIRVVG